MFQNPDPDFLLLTGLIPQPVEFFKPALHFRVGGVWARRGFGNVLGRRDGFVPEPTIPWVGASVIMLTSPDLIGNAVRKNHTAPFRPVPIPATYARSRRDLDRRNFSGQRKRVHLSLLGGKEGDNLVVFQIFNNRTHLSRFMFRRTPSFPAQRLVQNVMGQEIQTGTVPPIPASLDGNRKT